jgi:hypothetical protein
MAKDADNRADSFESGNTGGVLSGFLAEEDEFDRRALWRLGSWGVGSVGAVVIALVANQSSIGWRHEQIASADLARQSQQIQTIAKESQSEARRLASAIDTLNSDRDRLYSRVGVLEQGLDSVTGALARQNAAASPQAAAPPAASAAPAVAAPAEVQKLPPTPTISPVATMAPATAAPLTVTTPTAATPAEKPPTVATVTEPTPATVSSVAPASSNTSAATTPAPPTPTPLMASKSMMAPPDPAAGKLIESSAPPKTAGAPPAPEVVAAAPPAADEGPDATESLPKTAVQRTEFGVDVGGANSVGGLRALWRGLLKSRVNAPLAALRPIIVIKESSTGLGMQLRLVAGPLTDAAAAAKICAGMTANERPCETTVFDGQRLTMNGNDPPASTPTPKPTVHNRRSFPKHIAKDEPPPKKPEPSTMSLIFGSH